MKEAAVKEALEVAERRHTKELRAALKRLRTEMDTDKERAMEKQKQVTNLCLLLKWQHNQYTRCRD